MCSYSKGGVTLLALVIFLPLVCLSAPQSFVLDERQVPSCDNGGWALNIENWFKHNTTGFLRQWWFCANGLLDDNQCNVTSVGLVPLPGDPGTTGNQNTGNLTIDIDGLTVSFALNDYNVGSTNRSIPSGTADNWTVPRNPEAHNGLFNALKFEYTPKLNGTKCTMINDCLSDLGNCGNYNQSAPDGLRAYYTMLSMANLNDMFRQMYEALEGQSSHMSIQAPSISEQFTQIGSPDRYEEWVFLEVLQNLMAAVSAVGIVAVPELGAALFGARFFKSGVQKVYHPGDWRKSETVRANELIKSNPGMRKTIFDSYRLSSYNAVRDLENEVGRMTAKGVTNTASGKAKKVALEGEITAFEKNILKLSEWENLPGKPIPILRGDYYNLVVPKPSWRWRAVDACSKLVGLIPNLTGLFAIYFNKQEEQPDDRQWAAMGAIAEGVINNIKGTILDSQQRLFNGTHDASGWFIWDYIADGTFALQRDLTVFSRFSQSVTSILDWFAINTALKLDRNFIQGFPREVNGTILHCDDIQASLMGPWQTFFCNDDTDPLYYYFMYRIPISDVFGGLYKRRLKLPNGLSKLGVSDTKAQDPNTPSPYGVTVQDIMNSSIIGWNLTMANNLTGFSSLSWTTWLNDISRAPNPATVEPISFRGLFDIPVCLLPAQSARKGQLLGWPANSMKFKEYPCTCQTHAGEDFTQQFYDRSTFIDKDFALVCKNKSAISIAPTINEAVVDAQAVQYPTNLS